MYQIEIRNQGGDKFQVKSQNYEFLIGQQQGISPPAALLASLGACIGVYIRKYFEGAKIAIKEFSISVSADFAKDRPARFAEINAEIDLKGIKLDERRKAAFLEFIKNCPVHNTLESPPAVDIKIT